MTVTAVPFAVTSARMLHSALAAEKVKILEDTKEGQMTQARGTPTLSRTSYAQLFPRLVATPSLLQRATVASETVSYYLDHLKMLELSMQRRLVTATGAKDLDTPLVVYFDVLHSEGGNPAAASLTLAALLHWLPSPGCGIG